MTKYVSATLMDVNFRILGGKYDFPLRPFDNIKSEKMVNSQSLDFISTAPELLYVNLGINTRSSQEVKENT